MGFQCPDSCELTRLSFQPEKFNLIDTPTDISVPFCRMHMNLISSKSSRSSVSWAGKWFFLMLCLRLRPGRDGRVPAAVCTAAPSRFATISSRGRRPIWVLISYRFAFLSPTYMNASKEKCKLRVSVRQRGDTRWQFRRQLPPFLLCDIGLHVSRTL